MVFGFWDESILVGFVNIFEEKEEVFIGIGVNPDSKNRLRLFNSPAPRSMALKN